MMPDSKFMVVIHVVDYQQAKRNCEIALDNGADGIFLADGGVSDEVLGGICSRLRDASPIALFIGMHIPGFEPFVNLKMLSDHAWNPSALWFTTVTDPMRLKHEADASRFPGLVFGEVNFDPKNPARVLAVESGIMASFVDVVTVAALDASLPPELETIQLARRVLPPGNKLAIASGMTPENVEPFLDYVDYFLVATGVSKSQTELDPARVQLMAKKFGNL